MLSTTPVIEAGSLGGAPQPVLDATGGLVLRPWEPADAATFLGAYEDPVIRQWHTWRPASLDDVLEWFAQYRSDWVEERGGHWAVTRDGGEVLGRIAMRGWNFSDGIAGCAYWVLPHARGAGVAPAALTALSGWALERFHRLYLDHSTRNAASCRVAEKSGFALEGTLRSAALHDDGRHDMHVHGRVR
jgi:RimJ/RimL family protein N-acetyltransferase